MKTTACLVMKTGINCQEIDAAAAAKQNHNKKTSRKD
jgi:hypothetical protein